MKYKWFIPPILITCLFFSCKDLSSIPFFWQGDIRIDSSSMAHYVDSENIRYVNGDVVIHDLNQEEFDSLNGLTIVTGNLIINGCSAYDISALSHLKIVGGGLLISFSDFVSLEPLDGLEYVEESLVLNELPNLMELGSFKRLSSDHHLVDWVKGFDSSQSRAMGNELSNYLPMNSDYRVDVHGRGILIHSCPLLKSFDAFDRLTRLDNLNIISCRRLEQTNGFQRLSILSGYLQFGGNHSLEMIPAFEALNQLGEVFIENNPKITSEAVAALRAKELSYVGE